MGYSLYNWEGSYTILQTTQQQKTVTNDSWIKNQFSPSEDQGYRFSVKLDELYFVVE